ncbi:hypothetical protein SAMN05421505_11660 [Sinosporangium album]|uniref:Uncharacterized protein n=1 Tax=Sinosporangium album TaxID=504805 RepID=A0A1G8CM02_9ACTN|nr:hypothetical protein [Sinosporangium album]SDH46359.1 hypothetical protein SAMN05421505_11660 [Sinosporangium album]
MGNDPSASDSGSPAGQFSGIDKVMMQRFIADMERAAQIIAEETEGIRRELLAADLPTASLHPLGEIGGWVQEQIPQLRQRLQAISTPVASWDPQLPPLFQGGRMQPYREDGEQAPFLSPAEAQRRGTDLGKRFAAVDPDDLGIIGPSAKEQMTALMNELNPHRFDAHFTAAFFAALGQDGVHSLDDKLSRAAADPLIGVAGAAFGTAVTGGGKNPTFASIRARIDGHKVAPLLASGSYPPDWLARIAAPMLAPKGMNHRKPSWEQAARGKALRSILTALGNNPAAARLTMGELTDLGGKQRTPFSLMAPFGTLPADVKAWKDMPKLADYLKKLNGWANFNEHPNSQIPQGAPGTTAAFSRMLAAASGALDEQQGQHGKESSFFAYTVITTADEFHLTDDARPYFSLIAASYAPEIVLGADMGDADAAQPSTYAKGDGKPVTGRIPGLHGAFQLSPEDTFRFMTTYAGTPEGRAPFESGMAKLIGDHLPKAVEEARKKDSSDPLVNLFEVLGYTRGFEIGAVSRVLNPNPEEAKDAHDVESLVMGGTLGVMGLALPPTWVAGLAWTGVGIGVSYWDAFVREEPGDDEEEFLKGEVDQSRGRQYGMAQILATQGVLPTVPPASTSNGMGAEIVDGDGHLLPFADIAKKGPKAINSLEQWFADNGQGGGDELSAGALSEKLATAYEGTKGVGFNHVPIYKSPLTTD